jgi:transposase, IS5 family
MRTCNDQPTLWESVLPQEAHRMPVELARVDALLHDERFFAPFRAYFDLTFGRPSIPVETCLQLMFLKVPYRRGYESLCVEVTDSIGWRLCCRMGIDGRAPHPTTLMNIIARCGSEVIEQLSD